MSVDNDDIFKVYGKHLHDPVPEKYKRAMQAVLPHTSGSVPWNLAMPSEAFKAVEKSNNQQISLAYEEIGTDLDYYKEIYSKTNSVFGYLHQAKVNFVKHKIYSLTPDGQNALSSWKPDKYGYVPVPKYVLNESVTGRMKIKSGPNILLLPKKFRDILVSRWGNEGSIWYLDFTSLEPRVALSLKSYISSNSLIGCVPLMDILNFSIEEPLPKDVYSLALKKLKLSTEVSREDIKQIVLSQLYGQSKSLTIEALEKHKVRDPDEVVEMVNDFFGIDDLRQYVTQEYLKTGSRYLTTFYRRHLTPEDGNTHALLNYYIQSTAVDVALLGFQRILDKLASVPNSSSLIAPLYLLHDGLILDVKNVAEHLIPKLCSLGSQDIPGFRKQTFWMSGNKL